MFQRLMLIVASAVVAVAAMSGVASAHAVGGRLDLPVPVSFFVVDAGTALVVSFALLIVLWPRPRLQELGRDGR